MKDILRAISKRDDALSAALDWAVSKLNKKAFIESVEAASLLGKLGAFDEAESVFAEAEHVFPESGTISRCRGRMLYFAGRRGEARLHLSRAVRLDPDQPLWVYYLIGRERYDAIFFGEKVAYIPMPKNSSTSIKSAIHRLSSAEDLANPHAAFGNPFFLTKDIKGEIMRASFVFAILRDPVKRICSYHQKNIIEEGSLAQEYGEDCETAYGLPLRPSLAEFVENLGRYFLIFNDVFHHCLPQRAYLHDPSIVDRFYSTQEIDKVFKDVPEFQALQKANPNFVLPSKMRSSGTQKQSVPSDIVRSIELTYADDCVLYEQYVRNDHGVVAVFGDAVGSVPERRYEYDFPEYNNDKIVEHVVRKSGVNHLRMTVNGVSDSLSVLRKITIHKLYEGLWMKRNLGLSEVLERIIWAKRHQTPLSLVRLGDGEGLFLPEKNIIPAGDIGRMLEIQFGSRDFSQDDIRLISKMVQESAKKADILGIPTFGRLVATSPNTRVERGILGVFHFVAEESFLNSKEITGSDIHIRMWQKNVLYDVLRGESVVGVISCREEISSILTQDFDVQNVDFYEVPTEAELGKKALVGKHFPDRMHEIEKYINVKAGQVFLVAAGLLGKHYCGIIRDRGGIALDIGSIADAMAGVSTRPYIKSS
ncbi:MAG: hypothetical protein GVY13_12620 [Alphaproteobacteria bacterium]|jgi:tetratricopeptide (TPR) repeat protein|nr:hypothetical protein [Alphaproteobacteria bacterium]